MKEIEILASTTLEDAVYELKRLQEEYKEACFADFNGKKIYSTESVNDAYVRVIGKSKEDFDNDREKQINEHKRQQEEHKLKIPELIKYWIEEGHKHISPEYWSKWDECVPIRLNDLYQGMELDCTIKIIKILNVSDVLDNTYEDAKMEIESQGHSGMSFELVKSMIQSFHKNGYAFNKRLSNDF